MAVPAYLVAVALAHAVQGFVSATVGVAANAVLVALMVNHVLFGGRLREEEDPDTMGASRPVEAVAVLALLPLLGVVAGALPLPRHSPSWVAAVSVAMLTAAVVVARPSPLRSVTSLFGAGRAQVVPSVAGALLGLGAFAVLRPEPLDGAGAAAPVAGATVVVLLLAGAVWELVFRGMVAPTLASALGGDGTALAAAASAAAAAGIAGAGYAAVMAVTGLVLGAAVSRTGSVLGAVVGHALLLAGLLVVWPAVLG